MCDPSKIAIPTNIWELTISKPQPRHLNPQTLFLEMDTIEGLSYQWSLYRSLVTSRLHVFPVYSFGISAEARGRRWFGNDSSKKLDWDPQDPVSSKLVEIYVLLCLWPIGFSLHCVCWDPRFHSLAPYYLAREPVLASYYCYFPIIKAKLVSAPMIFYL